MPTRYSCPNTSPRTSPRTSQTGLIPPIFNCSTLAQGLPWRWSLTGLGALLWGVAIGFDPAIALSQSTLLAQHSPQPQHSPQHQHSPHGSGPAAHSHGRFDIPAGQPVPQVAIAVRPDPMKGWTVQVQVQNFQFAPEQIDRPGAWNAGHAHLYINGRKLTRLYGPWYYLDGLPRGNHQVTVTLNTNSHQDLYANGRRIEASATVSVP